MPITLINAGATQLIKVGAKKGTPPQSILSMDKGGNILLDGKTSITFKVGGNSITISEKGIITTADKGVIESTAKESEVSITANKDITLSSETAIASFRGKTETNVGGSEKTYITGADVEINQS